MSNVPFGRVETNRIDEKTNERKDTRNKIKTKVFG